MNMLVCIVVRLLIVLSRVLFLEVEEVLMLRLIMLVDRCLVVILKVVCVCVEFLKKRLNMFLLCRLVIFLILCLVILVKGMVVLRMLRMILCGRFLMVSKCCRLLFLLSCGLCDMKVIVMLFGDYCGVCWWGGQVLCWVF